VEGKEVVRAGAQGGEEGEGVGGGFDDASDGNWRRRRVGRCDSVTFPT